MKTLDMLGQPCPIPVVKAKEVLAGQDVAGVVVVVDNMAAVQNLEKLAKGTGCGFSYVEEGEAYRVTIVKGANAKIDAPDNAQQRGPAQKLLAGIVVFSCATACRFFWLYALNVSRAVSGRR
jgi:TusA-related sulfurtransferase